MNRYSLLSILLCLVAPFCIFANEDEPYINNQEMLTSNLSGLIISGDHLYPPEYIIKTTEGVFFYRVLATSSSYDQIKFLERLERDAIGRAITYADIEGYKKEIADYFLINCNKYVFVEMLKGGVDSSIIVLKVSESKVGEIIVSGNNWFSKEFYKNNIGLFPNGTLDGAQLRADVSKINSSPWAKAEIVCHQGNNNSLVDVELLVKDTKPVQFYSGANNTGVETTGASRLYAGATWRSNSISEKALSFEYEMNPNFKNFSSYTMDYTFTLNDHGRFYLEGNYSHVKDYINDKGTYIAVTGSFDLPLLQSFKRYQNLSLFLNYKGMNNDFLSGGVNTSKNLATVLQLGSKYCFTHFLGPHEITAEMGFYFQPFPFISERVYSELRMGAQTRYIFGRGAFSCHLISPNSRIPSIIMRASGQITTARLLPSEQFGLGGVNSVRGYVEKAFVADQAVCVSIEFQSPKISLMKYVANRYRHLDKLYGSFFIDGGQGIILHPKKWEDTGLFLLGVGPSLSYDIMDTIFCRLDLGIRLGSLPEYSIYESRTRLYFSVGGSY